MCLHHSGSSDSGVLASCGKISTLAVVSITWRECCIVHQFVFGRVCKPARNAAFVFSG